MPRNNARVDPRFKKAVENILKHPTLTVPDAMKLANFSPQEQACRAKHMIVYCELDKAKSKQGKSDAFVTHPPQLPSRRGSHERSVSMHGRRLARQRPKESLVPASPTNRS